MLKTGNKEMDRKVLGAVRELACAAIPAIDGIQAIENLINRMSGISPLWPAGRIPF